MSNPRLTQNAELGWPTGDQPGELRFQYAPSEAMRAAILGALSSVFEPARTSSAELYALSPVHSPAGRYRLTTPAGKWFVRVSRWLGDAAQEKQLVDYLASRNVMVNPLLVAGITLEWEDRVYRIDVRPLIEGRHFNGTLDDLAQMASTLAACHSALDDFPFADPVRRAAHRRYQQYMEINGLIDEALLETDFQIFGEQKDWAREHSDWLREMVKEFIPLFHQLPGAQCIHGQVHPGNVLFQDSDGAAVLVDWEEAVYNYAPPAFDLAYFVQRFCLSDDPTPDVLRQRLDTIATHYGALPPLAEMMRQLAWMSFAAIVDFQMNGIATPISEYEKFVRLEQQARALVGVV
ncbi:MAG: phosphotransferase [Acidobacteriales bacterium]|nr:phosphotransferase [Terriglobales bacterium]